MMGQTVVYDFNQSSQLDQLNGTGTVWSWQGSGGVGDTGWMTTSENQSGGFLVTKYVTAENTINLSTNFLWQDAVSTGPNQSLGLGIKLDDGASPGMNSARKQVVVSLGYGSQGRLRLGMSSVDADTGTSLSWNYGSFMDPLQQGEWYHLSASFTINEATNQISVVARLYGADSETGNAEGSLLSEYTRTYTNASLADAPGLLTFIGTQTNLYDRGFAGIDNFTTVIPESASYVWYSALLIVGWAWRKKLLKSSIR